MLNAANLDAFRYQAETEHKGKLMRSTDLGMYPVFYLTADCDVLCPDCANAAEGNGETLASGDVHWEGDAISCDECNTEIESAYGPLENGGN